MASSPWTPVEIAERWKELSEDESVPYPLQLMAEEFGYPAVHSLATRMRRLGIEVPPISPGVYERDHLISEIRFLRAAGQGVSAIAEALSLTTEDLVRRVDKWFEKGVVDFRFNDAAWRLEEEHWKSTEFALGPKSRNGAHGKRIFTGHVAA
jgi:hypothetical protein